MNYKLSYKLKDFNIGNNVLGKGSLASVKLITHKITKKKFALKEINIKNIHNKDLNNIKREIFFHKNIRNEFIIKLYDYFFTNSYIYMILEFANEGSLFDSIHKKRTSYDNRQIAKIIYDLTFALDYIHNKNILHRDIKPENILLNEQKNIKLADFGWCAELTNENRLSTCGTYEYMAPEILEKKPQCFKTDIWSVGVLLYELIHKSTPFNNRNPILVLNRIKNNIIYFKDDIDPLAKDLIKKLLIYDKNKRLKLKNIRNHPFITYYIFNYKFKLSIGSNQKDKNNFFKNKDNLLNKLNFNNNNNNTLNLKLNLTKKKLDLTNNFPNTTRHFVQDQNTNQKVYVRKVFKNIKQNTAKKELKTNLSINNNKIINNKFSSIREKQKSFKFDTIKFN